MSVFDIFKIFDIFSPLSEDRINQKMSFVYSPHYNLPLDMTAEPGRKFIKLYELIMYDLDMKSLHIYEPPKASREDLEQIHSKEYLDEVFSLQRTEKTKYSELPLNHRLLESFMYAVGGTIFATYQTKKDDFVYNLGGGFHHAFREKAEGFCYFNDVAIATQIYLNEHLENKVLILDLDLHQGNGTSLIFQNNPNVFTYSIHQENLYPKKEKSTLDIGLKDYCNENEYLRILVDSLETVENTFHPDLIYYLAGADPYENDKIGNLKVSIDGLYKRDMIVREFAKRMNSKVVIVTAGGYAKNFQDTIRIHYNTARAFAIKP